eukprot:COSAG01_NODE_10017_length_2273_cov_10.244250_1_plen_581_part_00
MLVWVLLEAAVVATTVPFPGPGTRIVSQPSPPPWHPAVWPSPPWPSGCSAAAPVELPLCGDYEHGDILYCNDAGPTKPPSYCDGDICYPSPNQLSVTIDLGSHAMPIDTSAPGPDLGGVFHHLAHAQLDNQRSCSLFVLGSDCKHSTSLACYRQPIDKKLEACIAALQEAGCAAAQPPSNATAFEECVECVGAHFKALNASCPSRDFSKVQQSWWCGGRNAPPWAHTLWGALNVSEIKRSTRPFSARVRWWMNRTSERWDARVGSGKLTGAFGQTQLRMHKPSRGLGKGIFRPREKNCDAISLPVQLGLVDGAAGFFPQWRSGDATAWLGLRGSCSGTNETPSLLGQLSQFGLIERASYALYIPFDNGDDNSGILASVTLGGWGAAASAAIANGATPIYIPMDDSVDPGGWVFRGRLASSSARAAQPSSSQSPSKVSQTAATSITVTISTSDETSFSQAAYQELARLVGEIDISRCKNQGEMPDINIAVTDVDGAQVTLTIPQSLYINYGCGRFECTCSLKKLNFTRPSGVADVDIIISAIDIGQKAGLAMNFELDSQATVPVAHTTRRRMGLLNVSQDR